MTMGFSIESHLPSFQGSVSTMRVAGRGKEEVQFSGHLRLEMRSCCSVKVCPSSVITFRVGWFLLKDACAEDGWMHGWRVLICKRLRTILPRCVTCGFASAEFLSMHPVFGFRQVVSASRTSVSRTVRGLLSPMDGTP